MNANKERRLGDRKKTDLTAQIVGEKGAIADIRLLDISPTGARLAIAAELDLQKNIKLLLGRCKIEKYAELVWRNATQAGIRFISEADIDRAESEIINSERKRRLDNRKKSQITASVFGQNGMVSDIKLIDISLTGARLDIPSEIDIAKNFKMLLGRCKIERYAELVWRTANQAGVRFLSDEEIEQMQAPRPSRGLPKLPPAVARKLAGFVDPQLDDVKN